MGQLRGFGTQFLGQPKPKLEAVGCHGRQELAAAANVGDKPPPSGVKGDPKVVQAAAAEKTRQTLGAVKAKGAPLTPPEHRAIAQGVARGSMGV
jgi:hypothetical protein